MIDRTRIGSVGLAMAAFALGVAAPADAYLAPVNKPYVLLGKAWPKRHGIARITYYNTVPEQKDALTAAVKAWNRSGAHVRFVAASRRRAALKIVPLQDQYDVEGQERLGTGTLGYYPRRKNRIEIWRPQDLPADMNPPDTWASVFGHELGHVLGLGHVSRGCSMMRSGLWRGCPPGEQWERRCRFVEPNDVAGAIKRYGGRAAPLGARYCPKVPAPAPPLDFTATRDPENGFVVLRWRNPQDPAVQAVYIRVVRGDCPSTPGGKEADFVEATPGEEQYEYPTVEGYGRFCFAVWTAGELYRPSTTAATGTLDIQNMPPRAVGIDATPSEPSVSEGPASVRFCGDAYDPDGSLTAWAWNFGDGGTSSDEYCVNHTYTAAGTYTVTLTVTDNVGATSSTSRSLTVSP